MTNFRNIRKHIKESLKRDFSFDLVLIQIGFMFECIEEDAIFLSVNFDCQLQGTGKAIDYEITGFPVSGYEKYKQDLDSMDIDYCIVEQLKNSPDDSKNKIQRVVTFSTISGAEGLIF